MLFRSYGDDNILDNVSFQINNNEKYAICGSNGVGKSTLLKILVDELSQDSGEVIKAKDLKIGYLAQYDDNYINKFLCFIPICKLITSKYYANIDNSLLDENKCNYLIQIWEIYVKRRNDVEKIVNEITKDGFFKVLAMLYYKLNNIELKINMNKVFCDLLSLSDNQNEILINDGIIKFLAQEISSKYLITKLMWINLSKLNSEREVI